MKRIFFSTFFLLFIVNSQAQLSVHYNPLVQPTNAMQYFKPVGNNLFVGDCIPFYHDGTYYLYWLLDSAHHHALNGLGGHQWALSTTKDLKTWTNYPIVLGIDEDWEKSICTGSVVFANNKYYAFYATRLVNDGKVNEQLSYAISDDGIHFIKQKPNPFYTSAPGYSKRNFRDPKVSVDSKGVFHLFVSSNEDSAMMRRFDGALVHLTSKDLKTWTVQKPVLTGQPSTPECPDYFKWNDWYYLIYSNGSKTFYVKSKNPYGPWEEPRYQALNEDWSNVVKTAQFGDNRRIAAAWIPSRRDNTDGNGEVFGGNTVFREVLQNSDGTFDTNFPPEIVPKITKAISLDVITDSLTQKKDNSNLTITAWDGIGAAKYMNLPKNCRITLTVKPKSINDSYGLLLKADEKGENGYDLRLSANEHKASLANTSISGVSGLDKPVQIDIIMKDDIIDVCIDNRRCLVNRLIEQKGNNLWLYIKHGSADFKSVTISEIETDSAPTILK